MQTVTEVRSDTNVVQTVTKVRSDTNVVQTVTEDVRLVKICPLSFCSGNSA